MWPGRRNVELTTRHLTARTGDIGAGTSASVAILDLEDELTVLSDGLFPLRTDSFNMTEAAFPRGQRLPCLIFGLQVVSAKAVDQAGVLEFCRGDDVEVHDPAIGASHIGIPNGDLHFWIR